MKRLTIAIFTRAVSLQRTGMRRHIYREMGFSTESWHSAAIEGLPVKRGDSKAHREQAGNL